MVRYEYAPAAAEDKIAWWFRSGTGGVSWEWAATAAGRSAAAPARPGCVGASENHAEQLRDGTLIMVYRVCIYSMDAL